MEHIQHKTSCKKYPILIFKIKMMPLKDVYKRVPGWLSLLSIRFTQVMISPFVSSSPASISVLTAQSLEPALDSVSPSLSLSLPLPHLQSLSLSLSLSLSVKNKHLKKEVKDIYKIPLNK